MLFATAEGAYFLKDSFQQPLDREMALGANYVDQSFFAKLPTVLAHRLCDTVCKEQ